MAFLHPPPPPATPLHNSICFNSATLLSPKLHLHFPSKQRTSRNASLNRTLKSPISDKWRTGVSSFSAFFNKGSEIESLKQQLIDAIAPLDRGTAASPEDQQLIDQVGRYHCTLLFLFQRCCESRVLLIYVAIAFSFS